MSKEQTYCERRLGEINRGVAPVTRSAMEELPDAFKVGDSVDWPALLTALKSLDNPQLLSIAIILAERWVTCACGNQCDALPRNSAGSPRDEALAVLGCLFPDCLNAAEATGDATHIDRAEDILRQIEARSAELLKTLPHVH